MISALIMISSSSDVQDVHSTVPSRSSSPGPWDLGLPQEAAAAAAQERAKPLATPPASGYEAKPLVEAMYEMTKDGNMMERPGDSFAIKSVMKNKLTDGRE
jgi:hypothetical protein